MRGTYNCESSLRLAKRVLHLMNELGSRAPQPREWKPEQQTVYDEEEPMGVSEDDDVLCWNSSWDEFTNVIQTIDTLDEEDFFKSFGT